MSDVEIGRRAINSYYSYMRLMYPSTFKYSQSEFIAILEKLKGGKALLDGLGMGIREAELSESKVSTAMKRLATQGGGKIPASYMDFFNALINEAAKISYVDAAAFVFVESTKDAVKAAESVGSSLIFTGKVLNFLLPAILLVFVYFWLNKNSEGQFSKALKGIKAFK